MSKAATIKLTDQEVEEMAEMGCASPSEYLRIKLRTQITPSSSETAGSMAFILKEKEKASKLEKTIVQMDAENKSLKEKLSQGLGNIDGFVNEKFETLVRNQELDRLRKETEEQKNKIKELEKDLATTTDEKEGLGKQLGFVDTLGKLLPAVVNGFSQKFPTQAERIVNGLSGIVGGNAQQLQPASPVRQDLVDFANFLNDTFTNEEVQIIGEIIYKMADDKYLINTVKDIIK